MQSGSLFRRAFKVFCKGGLEPPCCGVCNFSTSRSLRDKTGEFPPNSSISPTFINNRNPRNLEKLRIAEKAEGWDLEQPGHSYWNRLTLELTGKHITARITHVDGQSPISASTTEWCIKKFLHSTKDAVAAKTVGEVIAFRCLQAGVTEVACFLPQKEREKDKIGTLLQAIQDGGVSLEEPIQFQVPWSLNYPTLPEKAWEVHEDIEEKLEIVDKIKTFVKEKKSS